MKGRSNVVLTWRREVMTVWLGTLLEVVDNLAGLGSKCCLASWSLQDENAGLTQKGGAC
jgi:hypothetical protein